MIDIRIKTAYDLADIEVFLDEISSSKEDEVSIYLPRNLKRRIFGHAKIASLIATAAKVKKLTLVDAHHIWDTNNTESYFKSSTAAIAAISLSSKVINAKKEECTLSAGSLWENIDRQGGTLEPTSTNKSISGKNEPDIFGDSRTFCALDPRYSEPSSLIGYSSSKNDFIGWFLRLHFLQSLFRELQKLKVQRSSSESSPQWTLAAFIHELYSNSFEHGRYSKEGEVIPGLRFLALEKHIAPDMEKMLDYAKGFSPLERYFAALLKSPLKSPMFLEVSVADQGIGILEHFTNARPEFQSALNSYPENLHLLIRILSETLTSKNNPGAGGGLLNILEACRQLRGFLVIRTDRHWVYASYAETFDRQAKLHTENNEILEVEKGRQWGRITGTHISVLIPLVPELFS